MNSNTNMIERRNPVPPLSPHRAFPRPPLPSALRFLLCLYLVGCVACFATRTAHWSLVNDPAQLHYVCFLIDHGMAPYRDILEINMPGAYLVDWSVMHTLGTGSVAWRAFDFGLMGMAAWAMIAIAWPYDWLGGALAAALFAVYHGKDGAGQQGQRDLVIAVLLLCGLAFVFKSFRSRRHWPMFAFGLCAGFSVTIKPMPLPFFLWVLGVAAIHAKRTNQPAVRPVLYALLGFLLPLVLVGASLAYQHALGSFWYLLHREMPFYGKLGRLSWVELLRQTASPAVETLALLALAIAVLKRELWDWEMKLLVAGIVFGVASFLAQGKGLPYHRYPMVGFLFLWSALQFVMLLRAGGLAGLLAKSGLGFALVLIPIWVSVASRRVWPQQYADTLVTDLNHLGGSRLSGHVQCFDMPADCDAALYQMRLVQSTGLFYDYLIFGPSQEPVIGEERERFWQQFARNRPLILVVGKGLFPYAGGYEKLATWPLLQQEIQRHYSLIEDRTFPRADAGARAYRIYIANAGYDRRQVPR